MEQVYSRSRLILAAIVFFALAAGNILLGLNYVKNRSSIAVLNRQLEHNRRNAQIVSFLQLFIVKVLQAEGEVGFEDRLKLENDVLGLNDPTLFNQWQKFIASKDDAEAQRNLRDLLALLVSKIKI